ncbi:MAG: NAD(P)/FAD-dependent oxidoreductase [Chitinophagaceae bacterium]
MHRKKFIKEAGFTVLASSFLPNLTIDKQKEVLYKAITKEKPKALYDVIIIGGSYAGLSAALTLARCLRSVLVIDADSARNRFSNEAHNALTVEGKSPKSIKKIAVEQVSKYEKHLDLIADFAVKVERNKQQFNVYTQQGNISTSANIIFATGAVDALPNIKGLKEQWGKNVHHCPYCHGFETNQGETVLIASQFQGLELLPSLKHWCSKLSVCFNGVNEVPQALIDVLKKNNISWNDEIISEVVSGKDGLLKKLVFNNGKEQKINHIYIQPTTEYQISLGLSLGCKTNAEKKKLVTNEFMQTSEKNIYAVGDIAAQSMEQITWSLNSGMLAAIHINRNLVNEQFIN